MKHNEIKFDLKKANEAAQAGIDLVTQNNAAFVETARDVAVQIATKLGSVTADDLRKQLEPSGVIPKHYNAWGAVFSFEPRLIWNGQFRKSRNVRGHGNLQRVWIIREDLQ